MDKNTRPAQDKLLLDYFLLVFVITVPFWVIGGSKLPLPINLPASALATFNPFIAAAILTYRRERMHGVKALLRRAVDFRKIPDKRWLLPALLLMPLIYFLAFGVMRVTGLPLPDPIQVPLLVAPVLLVLFFITDAGEELGWTGYTTDPMQNRWGAVKASFILGVIWVIWHIIPFIQTGSPLKWIIGQSFYTLLLRMLIVFIYNRSGKSVFAANLVHVTSNLSWSLFPNYGSHYDPSVTGAILLLTVIVALTWGRISPQPLITREGEPAVSPNQK